jgi:hypothetical protein
MTRRSTIRQVLNTWNESAGPDVTYVVDLFEDNVLMESRKLPGKSLHYAQDVSENWDNGIIKLEKSNGTS